MNPFVDSGLDYFWLGSGEWTSGQTTPPPTDESIKAYRVSVGSGMPSRPILDSSGKFLFVQTSDARIHRIKVKLPDNPLKVKGWKEEN